MPLQIIRNDLTKIYCDAIVNATDPQLSGGGGVDAAIHYAAGPEMEEACRALGGCPVGSAVATPGFRLPCRWVIHAVGPVWNGEEECERLLASCYREALSKAESLNCLSVAVPLISTGTFGFPMERGLQIAVESIRRFLETSEMQVTLVVYGSEAVSLGRKYAAAVKEYIDDHYVAAHSYGATAAHRKQDTSSNFFGHPPGDDYLHFLDWGNEIPDFGTTWEKRRKADAPCPKASMARPNLAPPAAKPFQAILWDTADAAESAADGASPDFSLDESFSQMVLRLIDERGMKDSECYKRANMDRRLFSKIRGDIHYRPKKTTAVALAVALELSERETESLLNKAGYALSSSILFDVIVKYFLQNRIYDIFEINVQLAKYDQPLLGV